MDFNFQHYLTTLGFKEAENDGRFPPMGSTYCQDIAEGTSWYWCFQESEFGLNIHDFNLQADRVIDFTAAELPGRYLNISFLKEAHGDLIEPAWPIRSGEILCLFLDDRTIKSIRGILHAQSRYLSVGFEFSECFIYQIFCQKYAIPHRDMNNALIALNQNPPSISLDRLTDDLLNYRAENPSTRLFYATLAQQVLLAILSTYYEYRNRKLPQDDVDALTRIAATIDEHYMTTLPLKFLAEIAMMSTSKLKMRFKEHYGMTITEYTQRRRVHVAEHLLLMTDLPVGSVAKSVGYNSHSRFSSLFFKYKGVYPAAYRKNRQPSAHNCKGL